MFGFNTYNISAMLELGVTYTPKPNKFTARSPLAAAKKFYKTLNDPDKESLQRILVTWLDKEGFQSKDFMTEEFK